MIACVDTWSIVMLAATCISATVAGFSYVRVRRVVAEARKNTDRAVRLSRHPHKLP